MSLCWFLERKRDNHLFSSLSLSLSLYLGLSIFGTARGETCGKQHLSHLCCDKAAVHRLQGTLIGPFTFSLWTSPSAEAFDQAAADADLLSLSHIFTAKNFTALIPGTTVEILDQDSKNVIQLIIAAYSVSLWIHKKRGCDGHCRRFPVGVWRSQKELTLREFEEGKKKKIAGGEGPNSSKSSHHCQPLYEVMTSASWRSHFGVYSRLLKSFSLLSETRFFHQSYKSVNWNVWTKGCNENKRLKI